MQEISQENSDQPMDEREKLERDFEEYLLSLSGRDVINTEKIQSRMFRFQGRLEELRNHGDSIISYEQEEMRQSLREAGVYVQKEFSKYDFHYSGPTNYSLGRGPFRRPEIHNIPFKSILKALSGIEGMELRRDGYCLYISYKGRTIEILDGYEPSHENIASLLNSLGVSREDVFQLKLPQKLPHLKEPHVVLKWLRRRGRCQQNNLIVPYRIARHSPCACKAGKSAFVVEKRPDGKFIHKDCGVAVE